MPSRVTGRTLHFTSDQLAKLKECATDPNGLGWVSASEALSAYLCQLVYKSRIRLLATQGIEVPDAAAQLRRGFWASIDSRPPRYLDLPARYFPNASFSVIHSFSHDTLYEGALWQPAKEIHGVIRAVDSQRITDETAWFAAQPDKSKVKVDHTFGSGSFTVSQWSKHDMYAGVVFDEDTAGNPIHPVLVAPPFTAISMVDGLGLILSTPEEQDSTMQSAAIGDGRGERPPPQPVDVNLILDGRLWSILDEDKEFLGYGF